MSVGRVAVYGGHGALGLVLIDYFKSKRFWTLSIDISTNEKADANIVVNMDASWVEQENMVLRSVSDALNGASLDAILCVAGGWAGGDAAKEDMIRNADLLWRQSVWTSAISARFATLHLKEGGLLQLTGAAAALKGTPNALGYGMAKAAVHQLTKSLAAEKSGLPNKVTTVAVLPTMLLTPQNRKWMPKTNTDSWTPLEYIAELLHKWTTDLTSRPPNGSLVEIITQNRENELKIH